jgi:ribosomal protein S18 acetylase RimI-like enzyme
MAVPRRTPADVAPGYVIRPATAQDIPEIVSIWGELALHHARLDPAFAPSGDWREEYRHFVRSLLGRDDALALVGADGGRLVGYAVGRISLLPAFFVHRRRGYIHDVVIREGHRRRGVGRRLVEGLLLWMRGQGVTLIELTVASGNAGAVAFWERLGFSTYMVHMKRALD